MTRPFYTSPEGAFVIGMLAPRLTDQDWLLAGKRTLAKLRGNVLLGVQLDRTIVGPTSAIVTVFILPLYWPAVTGAFGISADLGRWPKGGSLMRGSLYELSPDKRGSETAARELAAALNEDISPLFAALEDEAAIIAYSRRHPRHPLLGWAHRAFSGESLDGCFGYMAAWSGRRLTAEYLLRKELWMSLRDDPEYAEHVRETIKLLGKRDELRTYLQEFIDRNRKDWKLDQAHHLPTLIEKAKISGQWPLQPVRPRPR